MKDQESVAMLEEIIEGSGLDVMDYSGRGMDGAECVAFTAHPTNEAIADLIEATQGDLGLIEELAAAIREMRTDSLGLGTVHYFPNYRRA